MKGTTLGEVSSACRRRLTDNYGPAADPWLVAVPDLLAEAAHRWNVTLNRYHDAGCASVLAVGQTTEQAPVLLKAWYDHGRYSHETAALSVWPGDRVPRILAVADDLAVAAFNIVAGRPGGAARPAAEYETVAFGLADLHSTAVELTAFPSLEGHLRDVVLPRIERRLPDFGNDLPEYSPEQLDLNLDRSVLLHGDLYRENVLFNAEGRPAFIDPLPMAGDPAFDWAFWVVYYDLMRDQLRRLRLATAIGDLPAAAVLNMCLILCIDGLLYYREVGDPRARRMFDVMATLRRA